jgi:hypothetical protein
MLRVGTPQEVAAHLVVSRAEGDAKGQENRRDFDAER